MPPVCALVAVDLQRYYIDPSASFRRWTETKVPGAFDYVSKRLHEVVIPSVLLLRSLFRERGWPMAYLRLCGTFEDRSDLHRIFREADRRAAAEGFPDLYPLSSDPLSDVLPELSPRKDEAVFDKTTFSGFASGDFSRWLSTLGVRVVVMTGLATSQCVDTTARDASDRGYGVIHIEDAQADYTPEEHYASLYASRGVCGGTVLSAADFCAGPEGLLDALAKRELL